MITRITKNLLKRNLRSLNLNPLLPHLKFQKKFSDSTKEEFQIQKRWKIKKLSEEEIKAYHDKFFNEIDFKKLDNEQEYELFTKTSNSFLETLTKLLFYSLPIPLLLFTLGALYTIFKKDENTKYSEEDYNKILKVAKLSDLVNTTDKSNYDSMKKSFDILDGINRKYGYPDLKHSKMYNDPEIKRELLRLIMRDLPETLTKDEKIDVLMKYDEALLKKFYYQDLGIKATNVALLLTSIFVYSVYSMSKRRVKKIRVDFGRKELGIDFSSLTKNRAMTILFDDLDIESLGNNEINIGGDLLARINTGDKKRDEYIYEYLLLLNDQKNIL